jgi:CHASE3 domain sensor protein
MEWRKRRHFEILAPGSSLRQRVAYSLAIVRLILVPVMFLAVYYLFEMGRIVDRIVNIDAPASQMAEQASIQLLEGRRAERNYFLLHDAGSLRVNQEALANVKQTLSAVAELEPEQRQTTREGLDAVNVYEKRLSAAVSQLTQPGQMPPARIQQVVKAYEKDLNDLLKGSHRQPRAKLIDDLRTRVESFDAQISETVQTVEPALRQVTEDLQSSGQEVMQAATKLQKQNWDRVQQDHQEARHLLRRAEWVLSTVSGFALLLSIWISFILPRQVAAPLVRLKEAVDHAAGGNYEIEFELHGKGEIVDLAQSLQNLTSALRRKEV